MNIRLSNTQLNNLFTTELLDKFNDIRVKVYSGYFEVTSPDVDIETFLNNFRFTINDIKTLLNTDKDHTISIYISDNITLYLFIAPDVKNLRQLINLLKIHIEHDIKLDKIIAYLDRYTFWYDTEKDIKELLNINLVKLNLKIIKKEQGKAYSEFIILKDGKEITYFTVIDFRLRNEVDITMLYLNRILRPIDISLTLFNMNAKKRKNNYGKLH